MLRGIRQFLDKLLRKIKLKPLSLAEKVRLQFGAAILLSLSVALLIPYLWMGKLTEKIALDAGRAVSDTVYERHFKIDENPQGLPKLSSLGVPKDPNDTMITWIRLDQPEPEIPETLTDNQAQVIELLKSEEKTQDKAWIEYEKQLPVNQYVKIIRAQDSCLICHEPEGAAVAFNKNALIGAIIARIVSREHSKTLLINRISAIIAGLLAATAAMIAFYTITQRIILRPIRQLRGLANNIADGNLAERSAISSGDEFEKLANAFNHMLDVMQDAQEKLTLANRQLDSKIVELEDRNIELFRTNRLKSEFLANMSHEVRTPLNAILGFAQILYEKPGSDIEKSKRYAKNIITSGQSLLNLINDLLDLAKAEAGKIEIHVDKTSIAALCHSLIDFFAPMSNQKDIEINLKIADEVPHVYTDPGKVRQILYNLLSNAIKFTPERGKISITSFVTDDQMVRISVKDNGPGIDKNDHEKIFEKFRQLDGSLTRQGDGTGLGLAICKELCTILHGKITLDSQLGKGATFHLDLPFNPPGNTQVIY